MDYFLTLAKYHLVFVLLAVSSNDFSPGVAFLCRSVRSTVEVPGVVSVSENM